MHAVPVKSIVYNEFNAFCLVNALSPPVILQILILEHGYAVDQGAVEPFRDLPKWNCALVWIERESYFKVLNTAVAFGVSPQAYLSALVSEHLPALQMSLEGYPGLVEMSKQIRNKKQRKRDYPHVGVYEHTYNDLALAAEQSKRTMASLVQAIFMSLDESTVFATVNTSELFDYLAESNLNLHSVRIPHTAYNLLRIVKERLNIPMAYLASYLIDKELEHVESLGVTPSWEGLLEAVDES